MNPPIFQIGRKIKWKSRLPKNFATWIISDVVNVNNHWAYVLNSGDGQVDSKGIVMMNASITIDDITTPTITQFELVYQLFLFQTSHPYDHCSRSEDHASSGRQKIQS